MILLPLMALVLRLTGLRRCQRIFSSFFFFNHVQPVLKTERSDDALTRALNISRLVGVAVRHGVCRVNCLQRSLTLWWMLRKNGIGSELHIGTRKEGGRLDAHAWIETEGVVLNDSGDVRHRYEAFDREISLQFTGR